MKIHPIRFIFILLLFAGLLAGTGDAMKGCSPFGRTPALRQETTAELWRKVEDAEKAGLPQTAVGHLKKIYTLAVKAKRDGEALRALTRQIVLESVVEGNRPGPRVGRLQEEISKAPASLKPMLRVVLAQWYWQYYSRNKWRFINRSATEGTDDKDFTTWDLRRLFREIDTLYRDILKDEAVLKTIPVSTYAEFLETGNMPAELRPTLYDFAAFEALDFYTSEEQAGAQPEDAFVIEADSDALAPAAQFRRYNPDTTDVDSPKLRALRLYQDVLSFHRDDKNRDVSLDADLQRLRYVRHAAVGESAASRYMDRLKELVEAHRASPLSSLALYDWAQEVYDQGDFVTALALARRGGAAHPESIGASNCNALASRITAKELDVRTESVIAPAKPSSLVIQYRNITTLHVRAVAADFSSYLSGKDGRNVFWSSDEYIHRILTRPPTATWTAALKPTDDYKSTSTLVTTPALKPGFYWILASAKDDFSSAGNKLVATSVWVSELGIVTGGSGAGIEGLAVLNASGEPVPGADVTLYEWDYDKDTLIKKDSARTDASGAFRVRPSEANRNTILHVRDAAGREVADTQVERSYERVESDSSQTVFFTDRAIYRPGQTIHFKGICLSPDRAKNDYRVLPRQNVRVLFLDVNRQEVASLTLTSNDFGSISGSFTAPTDRLTGEMRIEAVAPRGSCDIRVEEYKRPKFQVTLSVPDKEFRLNDAVAVPGEAMSYTGAPVDGALVRFRVVREVRFPWWWFFGRPDFRANRGSQEIAHGTARTDATGKFTVEFRALPDRSIPVQAQPVFTYAISVDITDGAGETRSQAGRIRAGYASLEATLGVQDWQVKDKPVVLTVQTTTLNGRKAAARGAVEVFALQGPSTPVPADLIGETAVRERQALAGRAQAGFSGATDWRKWPEGALASQHEFETSTDETKPPTSLSFALKPGAYKARLRTKDKFGTDIESLAYFIVLNPAADRFGIRIPFHAAAPLGSAEPGQTFELLWGTGYDKGPILVEVFQNGKPLDRFWSAAAKTQGMVRVPVTEQHRGGFTIVLTMVKDNRLYREERRVSVPWTNKMLDLQWKTFRSKLQPGQAETWSVQIKGPRAEARVAEMVASLYDKSLDQFVGHSFPWIVGLFHSDTTYVRGRFSNRSEDLRPYTDDMNTYASFTTPIYTHFPTAVERDLFGYGYPVRYAAKPGGRDELAEAVPAPAVAAKSQGVVGMVVGGVTGGVAEEKGGGGTRLPVPEVDLSKVQARTNLNETAFFYPHLLADKNGLVTIEFKMPEALTTWRFLGFAHTADLLSGSITAETVTQKELMVQPNPPRFLREGDRLEVTVKVTNMTEKEASGAVELRFFDPVTEKALDSALANVSPKFEFAVPAKQSRSFSWPVSVPDGLSVVGYKAAAATPRFSDGEEGIVPILSRRLLVRESIPLWISDKGEKTFTFEKLMNSGSSETLRHLSLTVQMASNPSWYAVQALPFLMEYPYECSEQVFNRLYANALAQKIANSNPKIRRIFDLWKGTDALKSNLEKNEDLKSVLLQESPWVLEAKNESQAKKNIGQLFDENVMSRELRNASGKLAQMQLADGSWPWFPGGPGNDYITLYLVAGFGRLKHLEIGTVGQDPALKALARLDAWVKEIYENILRAGTQDLNHLSPTIALYLYARSFYLIDRPIPKESRAAADYFLGQGAKYWLELDHRQSQGHLAVGLKRFGDAATPLKIMRSMKERSKVDEELGRYWRDLELSWWWYRAPIETQAVMIEAFDEVLNDQAAVEECKVWLLKQKQTQDWKTTKATADAVYALILRGTDLLASDAVVSIALAGKAIEPEKVEAGTGFYEKRFAAAEVKPGMGEITVTKTDKGIAWGGVHWQYMEDIAKITPHEQNPLKLKKTVFVQRLTKKGPVIEPVQGPLAVGDTVVIRVELRTDRDMEYVHMMDHRGSGLEPVNVLSQYKYQDGLVYYEATKDTATHFFIDYLPKGTYVFEYPLKVTHKGTYENGMAHIECMYAPEFNSHSESVKLEVR
jgi:uncharacterized protein YfaS (alpha-2-macroglobulin family)